MGLKRSEGGNCFILSLWFSFQKANGVKTIFEALTKSEISQALK